MNSNEIRRTFTDFFAERGHQQVPSSSLVPHNDPTVLLTTAGMQQMTPYFLGRERPPASRMTSIQKCFRTVDIDEVGDESHLTFFEMLGNFSVGDYFKPEAMTWAWELLTEGFGVPEDKWHPTVHYDDEFSFAYWRDQIGIPAEKIRKLGDEDNWWGPVGSTGPNGPDSEIFYDRGPDAPGERHMETWNLVFMEFYKEADGSQRPLPRQNIDTGMGLERLSMILQGKSSVFETDLYLPLLERASDIAGVSYRHDTRTDRSLRVIADHARAVTFLISDGVFPGNEGRSYVLRRVLRRAVRHGRLIGIEGLFLNRLAGTVVEMFQEHYPSLVSSRERIQSVIEHEEEHFSRTLSTGMARFETLANDLRRQGEQIVPGAEAFRLYDTYGFPIELTEELATDEGLSVDRTGFDEAMARQRATSRAHASTFVETSADRTGLYQQLSDSPTVFVGYDQSETSATIVGIIGSNDLLQSADAGQQAEIVLDQTPFYAESGGQVGDTGVIQTETGIFDVEDTQKPNAEIIVHRGTVREGFISSGQTARASIDAERRAEIRRNHTATHLLHAALRSTLGEHAQQAGSLVAPDRLRFDFSSPQPVGQNVLRAIQQMVNEQVLANKPVTGDVTTYEEATRQGAMALFGEKYGDTVRMVTIPGFSRELCGGTHVSHTSDIGLFLITEETSVASGIRRIEAISGHASAERALQGQETLQRLVRGLNATIDTLPAQVEEISERLREREREIERLRLQIASSQIGDLTQQATDVNGVQVIAARVDAPSRDTLLQMADRLRDSLSSGVIFLGALIDERPALLAMVTGDLVQKGLNAGQLIRDISPMVDGRGGGRPELAQGGGNDPTRLDEAIAAVGSAVERQITA